MLDWLVDDELLSRFWSHVDKSAGPYGCWPWTGWRTDKGYGRLQRAGRRIYAHRLSLLIHSQLTDLPAGMLACHTCYNPPCVNPAHLWLGTNLENMQDAFSKGRLDGNRFIGGFKTHCRHGHDLTGANLYINPDGGRICRACDRKRFAERKARKKTINEERRA